MSEEWHRSTRSGSTGNCVEVACTGTATLIRDSKEPHGALLRVSPERWRGFLASIGSGRCDRRKLSATSE